MLFNICFNNIIKSVVLCNVIFLGKKNLDINNYVDFFVCNIINSTCMFSQFKECNIKKSIARGQSKNKIFLNNQPFGLDTDICCFIGQIENITQIYFV